LTFRVNQSLPKRRPASIIPTLGRLVSPRLTRRSHPDCRAINRVFKSFDDIVDHCCYAWNTLIDQPWKIMSVARRDWARAGQSL
jgi:hypothetical protein